MSLVNALKFHMAAMDAQAGQPRWGVVASVDAANMLARVTLQPEGVLTGWLPVASPMVGNGWGIVAPPSVGQQVLVVPDQGQAEHGVIVGMGFSTQAAPPQPAATIGGAGVTVQPGEVALVGQAGNVIRLCADGTVFIAGDLHVQGDVYDRHGSLDRLRGAYNRHQHPDPQGGNTGTTTVLDPE